MIDCTKPPPYRVPTRNERSSIRITVSEPATCCELSVRTGVLPKPRVTLTLTAPVPGSGPETATGARQDDGERGDGGSDPERHDDVSRP